MSSAPSELSLSEGGGVGGTNAIPLYRTRTRLGIPTKTIQTLVGNPGEEVFFLSSGQGRTIDQK